jgi:hypothetical protein
LIAQMPDKTKPVILTTVGGNMDQQIGNRVQSYLSSKGYSVQRTSAGMIVPPPDRPFVLQVGGKEYYVQVAPSAR